MTESGIMFEVTIYDTKRYKNVGPQFFVGPNEQYRTLTEALAAANEWIKSSINSSDLQIRSSTVGFL